MLVMWLIFYQYAVSTSLSCMSYSISGLHLIMAGAAGVFFFPPFFYSTATQLKVDVEFHRFYQTLYI